MNPSISELRAAVRRNLAGMDETPAPRVKVDGNRLLDELWSRIERNKPTGRREYVAGRTDAHTRVLERRGVPEPQQNGIDALAGVLRSLATFTKEGKTTFVTYHDGEREPISTAATFLAAVTGRSRYDVFAAVKLLCVP